MHIVETLLLSKWGDPARCEDGLFVSEKFVAVIDGATSKGEVLWDGHTGGYHAKEVLLRAIAALRGDESAEEALRALDGALLAEYAGREAFFRQSICERLQATVALYSVARREVWRFGDCQGWVDGQPFSGEMQIDALMAEVRSVYLHCELLSGRTVDELRIDENSFTVLLPILCRQMRFANREGPYGYAVLDGFCGGFARAQILPVPPGATVVLATDGYPQARETLEQSEELLREVEREDPLCIGRFKSVRGFTHGKIALDDRAYVRFRA